MATISDKRAQLLNTLIKLGHIDRQESERKDSTSCDRLNEEDIADGFYDALCEIGLEKKDLLFLGPMNSLHSFSKIIRPVRSLENLKICPILSKSKVKDGGKKTEDGEEKGRKLQNEGDSSVLHVTSPAESKDVVAIDHVSNHLDSDAFRTLINGCVNALRTGGTLLMREYLHGSRSEEDLTDHFYFRDVATTCALLNTATSSSGKEGLQLVSASAPDPVGGKQEVTWKYIKVSSDTPEKKLQVFLDAQQYSKKGILKYEKVFGHRYVSTGGDHTTMEFCRLFHLQRGQKVLDVGCGIGGSAFFMAQEYGVHVHGVDLSSNMISIGIQRRREGNFHGVDFEICNVMTKPFEPDSYDLVYSRDVILHIDDKRRLFEILFRCLKPGGQFFITDYCCGEKEHSEEFKDYVKQRGYKLLTVADYGKLLEEVGFVNVKAEDRTKQFVNILRVELAEFETQESDFLRDFSQADYDEIVNGWSAKTRRCQAGDQAWGMFLAEKK
ncbi:hypothetical protein RvY_12677 [Ramazzottius varieornatus]|uniref:phosphoethanolamine N-methyltransferase n=1 Tax=Ramazzottius varieornatus TaxID=947166 RepID=A0A1D1VKB1_RAMVA|nr:hypothetical protein RvY_12677 [Ramazzottius varieornatus]